MTFGSLFAGIGGFDLGFERAGMKCRWQVEIDPYCQKVLAKHWPDVGRWDDVRTFPPSPAEDWAVDVICGGFPCQDISVGGKQEGLTGSRSGLWVEMLRTIGDLRPRFAAVENVAALLNLGLDRVLGDLAEIGYDAEWDCLPAAVFGAPHLRDRIFIVAHPHGDELRGVGMSGRAPEMDEWWAVTQEVEEWDRGFSELESVDVATRCDSYAEALRILDGIPGQMDRKFSLGNAVVPQIAEWIGRRIMDADAEEKRREMLGRDK